MLPLKWLLQIPPKISKKKVTKMRAEINEIEN